MILARRLRVCLGVWAFAFLASCENARPAMTAEESSLAQRLSGSWDIQFQLVRSPVLAFDTTLAPSRINGTLALVANSSLNRSFHDVGIPTNYGSYDLDLTPFGFDPRVKGAPPSAVAGPFLGDSVAIVFSPGNPDGEMLLIGEFHDGSVVGRWRVLRERSTGDGLFVFTRMTATASK